MVLKSIMQKAKEAKNSPLKIKDLNIPLTDQIPSNQRVGEDILMVTHPFYTFMAGCDYSSDPPKKRLSQLVKLRHNLLMRGLIKDSLPEGMQIVMALPCDLRAYEEKGEFQLYCPYSQAYSFVVNQLNELVGNSPNVFAFPTTHNTGYLLTTPDKGRIPCFSDEEIEELEKKGETPKDSFQLKKHLEQIALDPLSSSLFAPLIGLFPQTIYLAGEESEACFSHFSSYAGLLSPSRIVALARNIRPYWFPEFEITDSEIKRVLGLKSREAFLRNIDKHYWNCYTQAKIQTDFIRKTIPSLYSFFQSADLSEEAFPKVEIDFGENPFY